MASGSADSTSAQASRGTGLVTRVAVVTPTIMPELGASSGKTNEHEPSTRYHTARRVTSPLRVGGRITGVDESLRVLILAPASSTPLFASDGLPAGGTRTPWSTTVRFSAPHGTVLTIAVSTGGHLKAVEEFAITAIRMT